MTAQRINITPAEYLADPAPEPSLSSHIAKILLEENAAHARLAHPRLGGVSSQGTASTDLGTLIHRYVLGKGAEIVAVDAQDWRTLAARDAKAQAKAEGKLPVLTGVAEAARVTADILRAKLARAGAVLDGESEVPLLWREQAPDGEIWARAMLDHVTARDGRLHVYDVKTCQSAHPSACMRSVAAYGYDIQAHVYTRAAELVWPEYAGRVVFEFLFVEPEPPHCVLVARLDGVMQERGRRRWAEAVERWSRCLHTDTWPEYAQEPVILESPAWILQRESEALAARGEVF